MVLPAPVPARDYDVQPGLHRLPHDLEHLRGIGAFGEQVLGGERRGTEAAYGENGAIHGQRRYDHVDARAIGQTGVHHGRGFIDSAPHPGDDLVNDVHQVDIVFEYHLGLLQHPIAFDIDGLIGVHQNVVDRGVLQKRLQRTKAKNLIHHFAGQSIAFQGAERDLLLADELTNNTQHLLLGSFIRQQHQFVQVQPLN